MNNRSTQNVIADVYASEGHFHRLDVSDPQVDSARLKYERARTTVRRKKMRLKEVMRNFRDVVNNLDKYVAECDCLENEYNVLCANYVMAMTGRDDDNSAVMDVCDSE